MSTGSILHDIAIADKEAAEQIIDALEESECKAYADCGVVLDNMNWNDCAHRQEGTIWRKEDTDKLRQFISTLPKDFLEQHIVELKKKHTFDPFLDDKTTDI